MNINNNCEYLSFHSIWCTKRIPRCHSSGQSCPGESGPISQASLQASLGMGSDEPGKLCTEEMTAWDSFFSPVTIKLLQRIRTKTSFDLCCIRFIRIYRLLWSSARVRNELLTNHRRDIKTQGEGRWTRQGWIYPMFDVIRHIFTIPLQNQRNSKGEKLYCATHIVRHITCSWNDIVLGLRCAHCFRLNWAKIAQGTMWNNAETCPWVGSNQQPSSPTMVSLLVYYVTWADRPPLLHTRPHLPVNLQIYHSVQAHVSKLICLYYYSHGPVVKPVPHKLYRAAESIYSKITCNGPPQGQFCLSQN